MKEEIAKELQRIITEAYPGDFFPESLEEARGRVTGDTLADFALLECMEVADGEENIFAACIAAKKAMNRAIEDLEAVRDALHEYASGQQIYDAGRMYGKSMLEQILDKLAREEGIIGGENEQPGQQRIIPG